MFKELFVVFFNDKFLYFEWFVGLNYVICIVIFYVFCFYVVI